MDANKKWVAKDKADRQQLQDDVMLDLGNDIPDENLELDNPEQFDNYPFGYEDEY
jgi:hypothetical protein